MQNKMLYLKGYGDSIKEIQIYFNRMREENLTFDQVIEITISYLPWNILNEQYEAYTANRVSKIEDPEKNAVYYEIMFTKKEGATQSLPYEIGAVITAYPDGTYESRIECNPELQNLVLNGLEINTWDIELSH